MTPMTAMKSIQQLLESRKEALAQLVPKHLSADRLIKVALNCISKTPKLQLCTPVSLLQCLITAAELGLEVGGALGHAYLVPFEDRKNNITVCTLIIGYRGFIELARRSGQLAQIEAHIVHERDEFEVEFGLNPVFRHKPRMEGDAGKPTMAYMIARLKDGSVHCEVMTWADVMRIKARSRSASSGPWVTDEEEMAKKTVVRRGAKYMPMSSEMAKALDHDDEDYVDGEVSRPAALAADNAIAEQIAAPTATEKAKAAVKSKRINIVDMPTEAEIPPPNGDEFSDAASNEPF